MPRYNPAKYVVLLRITERTCLSVSLHFYVSVAPSFTEPCVPSARPQASTSPASLAHAFGRPLTSPPSPWSPRSLRSNTNLDPAAMIASASSNHQGTQQNKQASRLSKGTPQGLNMLQPVIARVGLGKS